MASHTVLVTGGAGYIGSHVVRQLGEAGYGVVVLDDLSTGFAEAVLHGTLVTGHTGDRELVARLLGEHEIETVMHFAAHTIVPESVSDPLKYYGNNTVATHALLDECRRAGVRHFVFSSTAAVYGEPEDALITEDSVTRPINPYGTSKLMSELMLRDLAAASDLRYTALRYFNVAGADPQCRIGQATAKATLLTKVACEAAVGVRPYVSICGTDYPTPDGTGIRDYIQVEDLASAHLAALRYLEHGGDSVVLNCGYGHGFSVREVLDAVQKAHGQPLDIREAPRRPDLDALADVARPTEEFALEGRVFYLHAPEGIGRSKLAAQAEKRLGVEATGRNLRTVLKLAEMSAP